MNSSLKRMLAGVVAVMLLAANFITPAYADHGRRAAFWGGLAVGAVGLGLLTEAERERYYRVHHCYEGERECRWVGGYCDYNEYGDRYCVRGHRECRNVTYCD